MKPDTPKIPHTDEEVEEYLTKTLNLSTTGYALHGIYKIKRSQGMGVDDAYLSTLEHWVKICEE